jgi:hypothetical protein
MDAFRYQHHAIPVPVITATNCILEATRHLVNAINGVQEAPPDKMAAIQSLEPSSWERRHRRNLIQVHSLTGLRPY